MIYAGEGVRAGAAVGLEVAERKAKLRSVVRAQGAGHTAGPDAEKGMLATLWRSELWRRSTMILCYFPLPDEVDTRPVLRAALNEGKQVALPRIVGNQLDFRLLMDYSYMPTRRGGLFQPPPEWPPAEPMLRTPLLIVPGLAFDRLGNRLGRGGGYYDRFLATWCRCSGCRRSGHGRSEHKRSVALCHPSRLAHDLPVEPHDRRVDVVIAASTAAMMRPGA